MSYKQKAKDWVSGSRGLGLLLPDNLIKWKCGKSYLDQNYKKWLLSPSKLNHWRCFEGWRLNQLCLCCQWKLIQKQKIKKVLKGRGKESAEGTSSLEKEKAKEKEGQKQGWSGSCWNEARISWEVGRRSGSDQKNGQSWRRNVIDRCLLNSR